MTSSEIVTRIDTLLNEWKGLDFWINVTEWAAFFEKYREPILHLTQDPNPNSPHFRDLSNALNNFLPKLKAPNLKRMHIEIGRAEDAIRQFVATAGPEDEISAAVIQADSAVIEQFVSAFERFLKSQTHENAALLLNASDRWYFQHQTVAAHLRFIRERLASSRIPNPGTDEITFHYTQSMTLREVADILHHLDDLYETLRRLVGDEHPMEIVKIETGSLAVAVSGSVACITLMSQVMRYLFKYLSLFTHDSEIRRAMDDAKLVVALTSFVEKLDGKGYDVSSIKTRVPELAQEVFNRASGVLSGRPSIIIDGKRTDSPGTATSLPSKTMGQLDANRPKQLE